MNISQHGQARTRQRAIPSLVATLLLDYGSRIRCGGAEIVFVSRVARKEIRRALGGERNMRIVEPWLNSYLIVADDGTIITAARRTRRLRRT
jgi:hypothetical protein